MNLDSELRSIPLEKLKVSVSGKKAELQVHREELLAKANEVGKRVEKYTFIENEVLKIQRYVNHPFKLLSLLESTVENVDMIQEIYSRIKLLSYDEIIKDGNVEEWVGRHDELYKTDKSKINKKTIIMEERYWTLLNDKIFVQTSIQDMIDFLIRDGIVSKDYNREDLLKDLGRADVGKTLFEYSVCNDHIKIDNYLGVEEKNVVIPETLDGLPVTEIGNEVFRNCKAIEEIVLPDSIIRIGKSAFRGSGVRRINLPEGLLEMGESTFESSMLQTIHIPSTLVEIPQSAFEYSMIKKVTFSEGVTQIGSAAFSDCLFLQKIDIPWGIKIIKNNALHGIENVRLPDTVENFGESNRNNSMFGFSGYNTVNIFCNARSDIIKFARQFGFVIRKYDEFDLL